MTKKKTPKKKKNQATPAVDPEPVRLDKIGRSIANVTGKDEDGVKEEFREALKMTNLAFVLSDVVASCVKKADESLSKVGKAFRHEDKVMFNRMRDSTNKARIMAETAAKAIYQLEEANTAKMDADWFFEVADLCMTKISENKMRAIMITSWLKSMKDEEVVIK